MKILNEASIKLALRIAMIPFTALFSFFLLTSFTKSVNDISYRLTEDWHQVYLRFDTRATVVLILWVLLVTTHFGLEIGAFFSSRLNRSRLMTNFRYAPIAILIISTFAIVTYDLGMIEISRHRLRNYVYSGRQSVGKPDLWLHNDDRGWCGNGASAREKYLYFDTAASGLNDSDPYVRSRSFLAAAHTRDFLNGGNLRFDQAVRESCSDESPVVRQTVEEYLISYNSSCSKVLRSSTR